MKRKSGKSGQSSMNNLDNSQLPLAYHGSFTSRCSSNEINYSPGLMSLDLSLYQLNSNYRSTATNPYYDPLAKWLFPFGSMLSEQTLSPKNSSQEEAQEAILLGPWCKRRQSATGQEPMVRSRSRSRSSTKNSVATDYGYIDLYISSRVKDTNTNPKLRWHIPDTELYQPMEAIQWPGNKLSRNACQEELETHEPSKPSEQLKDDSVHEHGDEDYHTAIENLKERKSEHIINRKPVDKFGAVIEDDPPLRMRHTLPASTRFMVRDC